MLAGVSIGTVAGIPAGTLIGEAFGWRAAFETAAVVTVAVGLLIATFLPALPGERSAGISQMLSLAGEQRIRRMFAAALLIYVGHFAAYTYLAPFVQEFAHIGVRRWARYSSRSVWQRWQAIWPAEPRRPEARRPRC